MKNLTKSLIDSFDKLSEDIDLNKLTSEELEALELYKKIGNGISKEYQNLLSGIIEI